MLAKRLPALQLALRRWPPLAAIHRLSTTSDGPSRSPAEGARRRPTPREKTSIFAELFPSESSPGTSNGAAVKRASAVSPSGPDLYEEFKDFLDPSLPAASPPGRASSAGSSPVATDDAAAPSATLLLSGTTPTLQHSDFARLAPQGVHMDGWAAGLASVQQFRDPDTLEPRGTYALRFESPGAAAAYAVEARRRHRLARRAVQPRRHRNAARFREPGLVRPYEPADADVAAVDAEPAHEEPAEEGADADADARDARAFALAPPLGRLELEFGEGAEWMAGRLSPHGPRPARPSPAVQRDPLRLFRGRGAGTDVGARVLVAIEGGETTAWGLRSVVDADGLDRNLAWGLLDGVEAVLPVPWLAMATRRADKGERLTLAGLLKASPPDEAGLHVRFVVSFREALEARRFVRDWHRRRTQSPDTGRDILLNATSLW